MKNLILKALDLIINLEMLMIKKKQEIILKIKQKTHHINLIIFINQLIYLKEFSKTIKKKYNIQKKK